MFVITYRKIFYSISIVLLALSVLATVTWGINLGIDFTGGSSLEINLSENRLDKSQIEEVISGLNLNKDFSIRETGETGYILKSKTLETSEKDLILSALSEKAGKVEEVKFNSVGPTLGRELKSKAVFAIIVVILSIMIYVAIAFSKVSKPVSSWKYGFITVFALAHDVIFTVGFSAVLGKFYGIEFDTLFVIALLVILGYSVNDTIVVFDRIRENLKNMPENQRESRFDKTIGEGLRQTFGRSINTSLTTLISLVALVIFGGEATKWFALVLVAGILVGTYSSIFLAAPMLVTFHKSQNSKKD
jgi:preprotein translocase subunit SecF